MCTPHFVAEKKRNPLDITTAGAIPDIARLCYAFIHLLGPEHPKMEMGTVKVKIAKCSLNPPHVLQRA